MIPYDELVAQLTQWRVRNGLPVAADLAATPARVGTATPLMDVNDYDQLHDDGSAGEHTVAGDHLVDADALIADEEPL
jgi:hypothetical protein